MQRTKQYTMDKFMEFDVVILLQDNETDKLLDMGITINEEDMDERLIKFSFDASNITEFKQSFIKYKGKWLDAVVCTYTEEYVYTPPLIVHYNDFKKMLNEYNKKNAEVK